MIENKSKIKKLYIYMNLLDKKLVTRENVW